MTGIWREAMGTQEAEPAVFDAWVNALKRGRKCSPKCRYRSGRVSLHESNNHRIHLLGNLQFEVVPGTDDLTRDKLWAQLAEAGKKEYLMRLSPERAGQIVQ
jgi:hypothetical protein